MDITLVANLLVIVISVVTKLHLAAGCGAQLQRQAELDGQGDVCRPENWKLIGFLDCGDFGYRSAESVFQSQIA
ncbi:MAG: hypothetical protein U1F55_10450 [Chitinivorax sp.]